MSLTTTNQVTVEGHVPRLRASARGLRRELQPAPRTGRGVLRLLPRRQRRRPVGRDSQRADRRALGTRHDGHRLLGNEGPRRHDDGARALTRSAELRGARRRVLAGVRAAGKGACDSQTAPGAPGWALRSRRTSIVLSSPIPIGWPGYWRVKSRRGSQAAGRRITPSHWDTTRANCCAASTLVVELSDSSSRTRSPSPLGLDVYVRLPETIPNSQLSTIESPSLRERLLGFPLRLTVDAMSGRSNIVRALRGSEFPHDQQRVYARNFEVPSGGGVGTGRGIARAYSVFATGGHELGLRQDTLDLSKRRPSRLPAASTTSA